MAHLIAAVMPGLVLADVSDSSREVLLAAGLVSLFATQNLAKPLEHDTEKHLNRKGKQMVAFGGGYFAARYALNLPISNSLLVGVAAVALWSCVDKPKKQHNPPSNRKNKGGIISDVMRLGKDLYRDV